MKNFINRIPVPMSGLMLALASAGNLMASHSPIYKTVFGVISALLLLLLVSKVAFATKAVLEDLKNPVVAGVAATFPMGIMVLSTYLKDFSVGTARILWILGIVITTSIIVYFTLKFAVKFDIKKVFTSWFVAYVGIVVASLTSPAFGMEGLGKIIFWFGFAAYIILVPIVLYRVIKVKGIPEPALPTLAIFAAPGSLCLAGYMAAFPQKNLALMWFMVGLSIVMLLGVLLYMPRLLKLKFYPSYSAFTFPFVVSAVAIKNVNAFLIKTNAGIPALGYLVKFEEILAVVLVVYVLIRYMGFLFAVQPAAKAVKSV